MAVFALYLTETTHRVGFSTDGNVAALLAGCLLAVLATRLSAPNSRVGAYALAGLVALSALPMVPIRSRCISSRSG